MSENGTYNSTESYETTSQSNASKPPVIPISNIKGNKDGVGSNDLFIVVMVVVFDTALLIAFYTLCWVCYKKWRIKRSRVKALQIQPQESTEQRRSAIYYPQGDPMRPATAAMSPAYLTTPYNVPPETPHN